MTEQEKEYVAGNIESEGLEYTILYHSSFEEIEDEEFHMKRLAFEKAADELKEYLGLDF